MRLLEAHIVRQRVALRVLHAIARAGVAHVAAEVEEGVVVVRGDALLRLPHHGHQVAPVGIDEVLAEDLVLPELRVALVVFSSSVNYLFIRL